MHRHTEAEEAQARFGDDDDGHAKSGDYRDARQGIGNHMVKNHVSVSGAQGLSRSDEIALLQRQHFAAHDPAILHPAAEHQRHDEITDALAKKGHYGNGDQEKRKGEKDFRDLADDFVSGAAKISGDSAERAADQAGENHRRRADHQRDPRAVNNPAQHIAAEIVGAEQIGLQPVFVPARRAQPVLQGLRLRIARRDQRRGDAADHQQCQDRSAHPNLEITKRQHQNLILGSIQL